MRTKNYKNARNYSNDSKYIEFTSEHQPIVIGGVTMGQSDIDDIFDHPEGMVSVDNIIQDLISVSYGSIGEVKATTEKISPAGLAQVDRWEFTPTDFTFDFDTKINILGVETEFKAGNNLKNIVNKTLEIIQNYIDDNKYFSKVEKDGDYILEVEYIDRRDHDPKIIIGLDEVVIEKNVMRETIYGFGQWIYLGSKDVEFESNNRTIYYYQRVG